MKISHYILLSITAAFLCIMLGFYMGRNTLQNIRISPFGNVTDTQNSINSENTGKLNINTATAEQLQLLPGIGESLAQRIIAYREENGAFATINELLNVDGIGQTRLNDIKDLIYISN